MTKEITQNEFLHRIRTSQISKQEDFTDKALIMLYDCFYYPNDFDVALLLSAWKEFRGVESAIAYYNVGMRHIDEFVLRFNGGVLVRGNEVEKIKMRLK